ncbi:hypothetical protein P8822_00270 [Bacillus sonorensis]|uniref:hypothetical protein n=1 Tax=Bacillus subtilis group TaxID=653685 RepID=UPI001FD68327|nr:MULTISPECIES: hypothetical protein [Bacillus subtilis group]MCJ8223687.1 hypothetical protein [Bacillus paralicheniformis]MEC0526248.1 hypothetical protein [Bacillus sonorensis]
MNIINKVRKLLDAERNAGVFEDTTPIIEEAEKIIKEAWSPFNEKNLVSCVYSNTEDRGDRWTLWEVSVFKVQTDNQVAYFKINKEVGKTEYQSDGRIEIEEVIPKKVTITKYITVEEAKTTSKNKDSKKCEF